MAGRKQTWVRPLLIVGLAIDMLLIGYVVYLLWDSMHGPTAGPPAPIARPVVDLWEAYGQAQAAVQAQVKDAQLVSAATQWQAVSEEVLLNGASNWSFVFYSPGSSSSYDVVVDAGQAQVVNRTQVWVAPGAMAGGAWQAGPRDALLVFLAYDGRAFLDEHPQAVVDLHLGKDDAGRAVWTVVALDPEDLSLLSVLIDAETREVLFS